jgi:hypothetical protein
VIILPAANSGTAIAAIGEADDRPRERANLRHQGIGDTFGSVWPSDLSMYPVRIAALRTAQQKESDPS